MKTTFIKFKTSPYRKILAKNYLQWITVFKVSYFFIALNQWRQIYEIAKLSPVTLSFFAA